MIRTVVLNREVIDKSLKLLAKHRKFIGGPDGPHSLLWYSVPYSQLCPIAVALGEGWSVSHNTGVQYLNNRVAVAIVQLPEVARLWQANFDAVSHVSYQDELAKALPELTFEAEVEVVGGNDGG